MKTAALPPALVERLRAGLAPDALLLDGASQLAYSIDNSSWPGRAQGVALPRSHEEVEAVVRACREYRVPIVARGRGSNTTGASVPSAGGLVVSFERMNRILAIDIANRVAVVEPGVLNGELQTALAAHGFFWAPDPTSAPWSTVGGNLACNAGGPRTVKYGACRDNILAIRAVSGTGEGFRSGAAVSKNSSGYDLARLLVGSEGTLALITEATLLLLPLPQARRGVRALYDSVDAAAQAVARIMTLSDKPAALEFMDSSALALIAQRGVDLPEHARALLLLEVDGRDAAIDDSVRALCDAAAGEGVIEITTAATAGEMSVLWSARKALSPALKSLAPNKINEDVVVPVSRLPELVSAMQTLESQHPLKIVCFGHAGNGNLHVNLMYDGADTAQAEAAERCLQSLFESVIALGGTLSGEHGIGLGKRSFMTLAHDPATLALMRGIKRTFDPDGLLNPGKLLP